MTKLNQIIALRPDVSSRAERDESNLYHQVQASTTLFGITKVYKPQDDDGDKYAGESKLVETKADQVVAGFGKSMERLFDLTLTLETTNCDAKADVTVDSITLIKDAPVTYLLFLEKQLVRVRAFVNKLPTLDPAQKWDWDADAGVHRSEPSVTNKVKKVPAVQVLYEATKEHPAQTKAYEDTILEGWWTTTLFSGALPASRKAELITRVDKLSEAVTFAREQANQHDVTDRKVGSAVFGYLLGE